MRSAFALIRYSPAGALPVIGEDLPAPARGPCLPDPTTIPRSLGYPRRTRWIGRASVTFGARHASLVQIQLLLQQIAPLARLGVDHSQVGNSPISTPVEELGMAA